MNNQLINNNSNSVTEKRSGVSKMSKPDRSDAHLSAEEEAKVEAETRAFFDGIAPKRHTKPSRSDYSAVYNDNLKPSDQTTIPELDKFQELKARTEKLVSNGTEVTEEFVETEYYKDLNCIDKQHHTTGTGFIKMENSNGNGFQLEVGCDASGCHSCGMGNPATNDWIPSAENVIPTSNKPGRSDI